VGLSVLQRAVWVQGTKAVRVPGLSPAEILRNIEQRDGRQTLDWLGKLPANQRLRVLRAKQAGAAAVRGQIDRLPPEHQVGVDYDWPTIGRPEQFAPAGDWRTWVIQAGRGFGKTLAGAQWVRERVERGQSRRVYIVGATASDLRDVMIEGPSGLLAISPPKSRPRYEPSKRRLTWPNGAIGILRTAEKPDRMRGPQGDSAWLDEFAAWKYPQDSYDQIKFGLRLGDPKMCITTTPRPIKMLREILKDRYTAISRGSTYDNTDNLAATYIDDMIRRYAGTRLGRQELDAELLDDNPNALWKLRDIDTARITLEEFLKVHKPNLIRTVTAIDPAVSSGPESAETGIVTCAAGYCWCKGVREIHGYVLEDGSGHLGAREWAVEAGNQYQRWRGDRVIAEKNQGGNLVEANLVANSETKNLPIKLIHAKDGKRLRAEPVAALYEQFKVHHVGAFGQLEDQMTDWDPRDITVESPDRLDASVHALTELMLEQGEPPAYSSPAAPIMPRRRSGITG
jgi:phage terminase large subunit-like protein